MPASRQKNSTPQSSFNLTQATEYGRGFLKFTIVALVLLMGGRFLFNSAVAFYRAINPPPPPPPTMGFNKLPELSFSNGSQLKPSSYQLELPGSYPTFPDRAVVLRTVKPELGLLSLEDAKKKVAKLGFTDEPDLLEAQTYRWKKTGPLDAILEMDIVTNNGQYTTDYLSRPELQINTSLPTAFDGVGTTKSFLGNEPLLPADVATSAGQTRYLKIVGGTLREAVSLSDAQVLGVDLFRTPINGLPTYTNDGQTGIISAYVTSIDGKPTIISLQRSYVSLDYTRLETYPLRSPQEAWQVLKAGQGHIASAESSDTAVVRSVSLGYYEDIDQAFIQPIYVFTGDNGFIGYVPALKTSVMQTNNQSK